MTTIWTEWLPDPVYSEVTQEEHHRFSSLVSHIEELWTQNKSKDLPERFDNLLQIFPLLFQYPLPKHFTFQLLCRFMETKNEFQLTDVERIVKVSLEVVLASEADVSTLVRYSEALSFHLRKYKSQLKGSLTIDWKPLFELSQRLFENSRFVYFGEDAMTAVRQSFFSLLYTCGGYYTEEAAGEIWELLGPKIKQINNPECFVSLGWLMTLLPTKKLKGLEWGPRFEEWINLFEKVKFSSQWNSLWFEIFARCIKYDTKVLIHWNDYASRLFTAFLSSFNLPIGTATGELRYSRSVVPKRVRNWFPKSEIPTAHSMAKSIIYLLRNDPTESFILQQVSRMVTLLEQFFHPSNGGSWTGKLASFLKHLVRHLMRVISRQDQGKEESRISPGVQKEVVGLFLKMAARGQYSKQEEMRLKSCQAISQLAYLDPQNVLSLVHQRFVGALESLTATGTLAASVHAFALCIRPMLIHGLQLEDGLEPLEAAFQAIGQGMMDLLPGLDANDTLKTSTVFRFFAAVVFSVPVLDASLPLDVELWSEEVLSRIFVLMENLEGPEARTDQSHVTEKTSSEGTFLSRDHVFFDSFLELFLIKLKPSLKLHVIKRIAEFLIFSPFSRLSQESSGICAAMVEADSKATIQYLVRPLIQTLIEDLPTVLEKRLNSVNFSHTSITKICWNLRLLGACLCMLGAEFTVQNLKDVCEVLDRALFVVNREIQTQGSGLLELVFVGLLGDTPFLTNEAVSENVLPSGVLQWVSKEGENWTKPKWHYPSKEELEAAEKLTQKYLFDAMGALEGALDDMITDNAFAETSNSFLNQIRGVLLGAGYLLRDFNQPKALIEGQNSSSLSIAGDLGIQIGHPGLREELSTLLKKLSSFLEEEDPTIVSTLVEVIDMVLNFGETSPPDDSGNLTDPDDDNSRAESFFIEPAITHPYPHSKCLKRRPYYLALTRVWSLYSARNVDRAYLKWSRVTRPFLSEKETVPEEAGDLMGCLFRFGVHPYEEVAELAHHAIEKAFRRFPYLATLYSPLILLPFIKAQLPNDLSMRALGGAQELGDAVFEQVKDLMKPLESDGLQLKTGDLELSELSLQDASIRGSVMLMVTSYRSWHGLFRTPKKTIRMIYALMSCRQNSTPVSQAFSSYLIWLFFARFATSGSWQLSQGVEMVQNMRKRLCELGKEGVLANWKYGLLANIFLIITLPQNRAESASLLEHFLDLSISKLPLFRKVGLLGIYAILAPISVQKEQQISGNLISVVQGRLRNEEFVEGLMDVLIEDHESTSDGHTSEGHISQGLKMLTSNGSFEEILTKSGMIFVDRFGHWPDGESIDAIYQGNFQVTHAHVIRILGSLAPLELSLALIQPLKDLSSKIQDQSNEKHELSTLAELLAGILASGAPFEAKTENQSIWETQYKPIFHHALSKCSLELGTGPFAVTIKYITHFLLDSKSVQNHSPVIEICKVLLELNDKTGSGQSTAEIKKLTFLLNVITELTREVPVESLPPQWTPIMDSVLKICEEQLTVGFQSVREVSSTLTVSICQYLMSSTTGQNSATLKASSLCTLMVQRFQQGVEIIQEIQRGPGKEEDGMEVEFELSDLSGKIGFAAQFILSTMHHPQSSSLVPILVQLLPGVFKIQELGDSRLTPLQMEAVGCFAALKYLVLETNQIEGVVQCLKESLEFQQWHARAAALIFLQVFWFHHSFLLTSVQTKALVNLVVEGLKDQKLEVQLLASTTLSGMLKGMNEDDQLELRSGFLMKMKELYPENRRFKKRNPSTAELTKKHGFVLGLKAFVMSHPYDIPQWMPEVLVAMLPAANDPPPIKTTVTKTLGDFRRTHENESHLELRNAFDEEAWESIQAVGACCSYFS